MKHRFLLAAAGLALALSTQAHATSSPDAVMDGVNGTNSQDNGPIVSPQLGSGGDPIGGICTGSPENATVVLALVSAAGLFAGRRLSRVRIARAAAAQTL